MRPTILITTAFDAQSGAFGVREAYARAVERVGGAPVQAREDDVLADTLRTGVTDGMEALAARAHGLLLSGGGDIAARHFGQAPDSAADAPNEACDAAELALCRAFVRAGKPVLGICRGMQVLNVALGGDLVQDIPSRYGLERSLHSDEKGRHTVEVAAGSWLQRLFGGSLIINSTHHQCVGRLAAGFAEAARLGPVIEAMEKGDWLGVQFHPERMLDEGMLPLFEDFMGRCRRAAVA